MKNIKKEEIEKLLAAYREGKTSLEEEAILSAYFEEFDSASAADEFDAEISEFKYYKYIKSIDINPDLVTAKLMVLQNTKKVKAPFFAVRYWQQIAASLVFLIAGFLIGQNINKKRKDPDELVSRLNDMKQEILSLKKITVVSLLKEESSHNKINALYMAGELDNIDPDLANAIINTIDNDESINVRLTAADLIWKNSKNKTLKSFLIPCIMKQSELSVQLKLLDIIRQLNDPELTTELRKILKNPSLNPEIRNRIELDFKMENSL